MSSSDERYFYRDRVSCLLVFCIPFLIAAVVFVMLSGSAEGFASLRLIIMGVAVLWGLAQIGVCLIWFLVMIFTGNFRPTFIPVFGAISPALLIPGVLIGFVLDGRAEDRSMETGLEVLDRVTAYEAETGACPEDLGQVYADARDVPRPAMKGAQFSTSDCTVSFESFAFLVCSISSGEKWICSD